MAKRSTEAARSAANRWRSVWAGGLLLSISLLITLSVAGCASLGEPSERKPLVPVPVKDLEATQAGNDVLLTFSVPKETADHRPLGQPPTIEIYRAILPAPSASSPAAKTSAPALLVTIPSAMVATYAVQDRLRYVDSLTAGDFLPNAQSVAAYVVRTRASPKKESEDSNRVELAVFPAPQPIVDLTAQATQSAVVLAWTPPQTTLTGGPATIASYRVYRANTNPAGASQSTATAATAAAPAADGNSPLTSALVQIGETTTPEYHDADAQFDKTYAYSVRSAMQAPANVLESQDSNIAVITFRDVFPPSVPQQLIVVPVPAEEDTPAHLDLSWAINPETDVAGYNVYRGEQEGTSGTKLTPQPLPTPAFRDMNAQPGHRYVYTITAVDRTGNESAASAPVTGGLPAGNQATP